MNILRRGKKLLQYKWECMSCESLIEASDSEGTYIGNIIEFHCPACGCARFFTRPEIIDKMGPLPRYFARLDAAERVCEEVKKFLNGELRDQSLQEVIKVWEASK